MCLLLYCYFCFELIELITGLSLRRFAHQKHIKGKSRCVLSCFRLITGLSVKTLCVPETHQSRIPGFLDEPVYLHYFEASRLSGFTGLGLNFYPGGIYFPGSRAWKGSTPKMKPFPWNPYPCSSLYGGA